MKNGIFIFVLLISFFVSASFASAATADAGGPYTPNEGDLVTLDASNSTGDTFTWVENPDTGIVLSDPNIKKPSFIAPEVTTGDSKTLTFELTVNDDPVTTPSTVSVDVTVNNVNKSPVADAGANQTVYEGDPVTLDGTNSSDDGSISSYAWTQIGTPAVSLTGAGTDTATFDAPFAGDVTLTFQLQVFDNDTATNFNSMTVHVMQNKWDVNQDNQVGLEDAIYALQTTSNLRDTAPSTCTSSDLALLGKTGQESCYNSSGAVISCSGSGQDGEWQAGLAWPNPRFTDMGDGTLKDNMTNLIWMKNLNCYGKIFWPIALTNANNLQDGICGLTDGSAAGDWRMPNVKELLSILNYDYSSPPLSNDAGTGKWRNDSTSSFDGLLTTIYWTSTTAVSSKLYAFGVRMNSGIVEMGNKSGITAVFSAVKNE